MTSNNSKLNSSSALLLQRSIEAGITSPKELANIMGNAHVETGGFSTMNERFNYSSSERIIEAVASVRHRFSRQDVDDAVASHDPRKIAAILYDNRPKLGNTQPGDGWRYHGRGYFQYTGRDNYTRWGRRFGVDLEGDPELASEPEIAAKLAIAYWQAKVTPEARENVQAAAQIINGGKNGMSARVVASEQWLRVITPELVAGVLKGDSIYASRAASRHQTSSHTDIEGYHSKAKENADLAQKRNARQSHTWHDIREVQEVLRGLGYRDPKGHPLAIDGTFGPNTRHAIQSFQRAHHLHVDGIVGKDTRAALKDAQHAPLLSEATNPQHVLYTQVLRGIHKLPQGTYRNEQERTNAAVALTISAHVEGLKHIDHVVLGKDGANLFAVQGRMDDPAHRRVYVDHAQAISQSMDHDTVALQVSQVQQSMHALHASQAMHSQIEQRGAVLGISR